MLQLQLLELLLVGGDQHFLVVIHGNLEVAGQSGVLQVLEAALFGVESGFRRRDLFVESEVEDVELLLYERELKSLDAETEFVFGVA